MANGGNTSNSQLKEPNLFGSHGASNNTPEKLRAKKKLEEEKKEGDF